MALTTITQLEDFDDSTLNPFFSFSGDWIRTTSGYYAGGGSFTGTDIGDSQTTSEDITFMVPAGATNAQLSFMWMVSSEPYYDYLTVLVNSSQLVHSSGNETWKNQTYGLSAGTTYTIHLEYKKDSSTSTGTDNGFIDNLQVTYDIDTTAPVQIQCDYRTKLVISSPRQYDYATSQLMGDLTLQTQTFVEDFEGTINSAFTITGDWFTDNVSVPAKSGNRVFRAYSITDNGQSQATISFVVPTGATSVLFGFWYRVSSESGFDKFSAILDGTNIVSNLSGEVPWTQFSQSLSAGTHKLILTYIKDESNASGYDTACIDLMTLQYDTVTTGGGDGATVRLDLMTKQIIYTTRSYDYNSKQAWFTARSLDYALAQKMFKSLTLDGASKQVINASRTSDLQTKQAFYKAVSSDNAMKQASFKSMTIDLKTFQKIFQTLNRDHGMKQSLFKGTSSDLKTLQKIFQSLTRDHSTKQAVYKALTSDLKTKQVIFNSLTRDLQTKQAMYKGTSTDFATLQNIFALVVFIADYPLKLIISGTRNYDFPTKQAYYMGKILDYKMKQAMFVGRQVDFGTLQKIYASRVRDSFLKLVISKNVQEQMSLKQQMFKTVSDNRATVQRIVKQSSLDAGMKQILTKQIDERFTTLQKLFAQQSTDFATLQLMLKQWIDFKNIVEFTLEIVRRNQIDADLKMSESTALEILRAEKKDIDIKTKDSKDLELVEKQSFDIDL